MKEITVKKESSRIWGKVRKGNLFLERALKELGKTTKRVQTLLSKLSSK